MKGRQNHHLTLLLTPAGAVHHPQKIGLNPTHPIQAEMVAAEFSTHKLKRHLASKGIVGRSPDCLTAKGFSELLQAPVSIIPILQNIEVITS